MRKQYTVDEQRTNCTHFHQSFYSLSSFLRRNIDWRSGFLVYNVLETSNLIQDSKVQEFSRLCRNKIPSFFISRNYYKLFISDFSYASFWRDFYLMSESTLNRRKRKHWKQKETHSFLCAFKIPSLPVHFLSRSISAENKCTHDAMWTKDRERDRSQKNR